MWTLKVRYDTRVRKPVLIVVKDGTEMPLLTIATVSAINDVCKRIRMLNRSNYHASSN